MSQEPRTASEALSGEQEAMSVVDRIAFRLMRVQIYGTQSEQRWSAAAQRRWRNLDGDERANYRQEASALLTDLAVGDSSDMPAWPEYEIRHNANGTHGPYDDIGDAVDFADNVWPGSKVFERTCVTLRTEWTEVTK